MGSPSPNSLGSQSGCFGFRSSGWFSGWSDFYPQVSSLAGDQNMDSTNSSAFFGGWTPKLALVFLLNFGFPCQPPKLGPPVVPFYPFFVGGY